MYTPLKDIAPLIQSQFPSFYNEEGPNFIQFVKAYYEWMDQQGPNYGIRRLSETDDIDQTASEYIKYFMDQFMYGVPHNIAADPRLAEKYILDLYRSKGSIESIKLFFRLIYNLDANIYTPQVDILKTSDGKWITPKFLEVQQRDNNFDFIHKYVTGSTSKASAYVQNVIKINTANRLSSLFYLEDISPGPSGSSFIPGEYITTPNTNITKSPLILGSPVEATVLSSTEYNKLGDILSSGATSQGEDSLFFVTELIDPVHLKGYINFQLVDGGNGYTLNSNVYISYGTSSTGSGATFKIVELSNTSTFAYNVNPIQPNIGISINAGNYGANLNNTNLSSPLSSALSYATETVGSIARIGSATSGDHNYNGSLKVSVVEPTTVGYNIPAPNGGIWGNNAVISATLATGNGYIANVAVLASGYGFNTNGQVITIYNITDNTKFAQVSLTTSGLGFDQGYWDNDDGFLNSDKYIQDSYYYQIYSYEVQVEKSLDKYLNVLKKLVHPAGNKVFGKIEFIDTDNTPLTEANNIISIYESGVLAIQYSNDMQTYPPQ